MVYFFEFDICSILNTEICVLNSNFCHTNHENEVFKPLLLFDALLLFDVNTSDITFIGVNKGKPTTAYHGGQIICFISLNKGVF